MDSKTLVIRVELLSQIYTGILMLFLFIASFFVFIINWETRFFGVKLDGNPAGLVLIIEAIIPLVFFGILCFQKNKTVQNLLILLAILFSAFFFILNGCIRLLRGVFDYSNCSNLNLMSPVIFIFIWIPVILLIVTMSGKIFLYSEESDAKQ
jgi:hypothetical protein